MSYSCAEGFTVRGTNGYEVKVSASPGQMEVTAESSSGSVEYIAPAKVTGTTIDARIGNVARIDVRFRPSGRVREVKVSRQCLKERPPVVASRLGRFVGTIKLHGERGYTEVSAHSATGGIGDPLANVPRKLQCEFRESKAERRTELQSIQFDGEPAKEAISLGVSRLFPFYPGLSPKHAALLRKSDHYLFLATAVEKSGGVTILRSAAALGGPTTFAFDDSLTAATISPPAPFTGTGTFVRNADGSTGWTGSLAVPLPGLGTVPLTGGKAELATVAVRQKLLEEELEERLHEGS